MIKQEEKKVGEKWNKRRHLEIDLKKWNMNKGNYAVWKTKV
jgi:hypothetical protein